MSIKKRSKSQMKDSNIQWLGDIPSHWNVNKAKYIFKNTKKIAKENSANYERLSLTMQGVLKRSKEDVNGLQPINFDTYQIISKDSLLFKLIDLENFKTSRVGYSPYEGLVSPVYISLDKRKDFVYMPYFYYFYFVMYYLRIFNGLGLGIRANLTSSDLLNQEVIIPRIEEQQQIADFLDQKTQTIDQLIEKKEKLIQLLEEKKKILINDAVTKGLNKNVKMKDSGIEWIGEIPEHWEIKKINHIAYVTKLAGFEFSEYMEYIHDGEIIALRALNLKYGKIDLSDTKTISLDVSKKLTRSQLHKGDILFSYAGSVGNIGIINEDNKYHLAPNVAKIVSNTEIVNPYFVLYYFLSSVARVEMDNLTNQSTQPSISMANIRQIKIPYLPLSEQSNIVDYLNNKTKVINKSIEKINQQIHILKEYKETLIFNAVTGKIDVSEQE